MRTVEKVVAYIVRDGRIVVLRHPDDPDVDESGIQVPAGTIEPGELPADAVLREAAEETGLTGLRIERYLGAAEYDMRPSIDALHVRHFFQLAVDGDVPERWTIIENADTEPVRFELYWLSLRQVHAVGAGQAALASRVVSRAMDVPPK